MSNKSTEDYMYSTSSLAAASQSWNWLALSQANGDSSSSSGRSSSVQSHRNVSKPNRPMFLNKAPTSTLPQHTKPKTISTATERGKPAKLNPEATEEFSQLHITERTISAEVLRQEMEGRKFIKLQQMDRVPETFTNGEVDWVTIGVVTRKTLSKPAANGSTFMVWGLSDLEGTELGIFLFGDAYESHWRESTGSIVAILNASLLPATEKNKFAFKVTQSTEVVKLGKAVDFGICKGTTSGEARCRLAVNRAKSQYCLHHIAANFMQAGKGRQQLNNSTGSLRKALFAGLTKPKNLSAGVYTSAPPKHSNSGWNPIITKKRKRNDAYGGGLEVPMMLSASGAVIQRGKTRPTHFEAVSSAPGERRRGDMSLMDQLREPPTSMNPARGKTRMGSMNASHPSKRAQKIVSAVLAGDGKPIKRPKTKTVNMIHFMNTGSQVKK